MKNTALLTSSVTGFDKRSGKVRDLYDLGEELLLVATDRISAFDVVMPNGIPDKGRVLTQISAFWFEKLTDVINHHVISTTLKDLPGELANQTELDGRFMLCKKTEVIPVECVVRGYLAGSGWKEYQADRTVCGIPLREGLRQCSELEEPIFTPATKAEQGEHDENVSFEIAANADLLLCESSLYDEYHGRIPGHLTAGEAGKIAACAGTKHLVLTHLPHFGDHRNLLKQARNHFKGPSELATTGKNWKL